MSADGSGDRPRFSAGASGAAGASGDPLRPGRLETLAALAGGVTHELGNLAAQVTMSVQLLEAGTGGAADRDLLGAMEELAKRIQHASRQLHWLARGVAGEPTLFQPQYLLADVQKLLRVALQPHVAVVTRYPPDLWPLAGDPLIVFQLLLAMSLEARDHLPPATAGTLVLAAGNDHLAAPAAAMSTERAESAQRAARSARPHPHPQPIPPGRYVVLEVTTEPAAAAPAAATTAAASRRRRKASEARRAAAAAGGFTQPLPRAAGTATTAAAAAAAPSSPPTGGRTTARGRRAWLPAADLDSA